MGKELISSSMSLLAVIVAETISILRKDGNGFISIPS